MREALICAVVASWLSIETAPARAACGDGKVDVSIRRTCASCVAGSTHCPCANVREPLEPCDGRDLNGATCQTQGFFAGTLRCTATCELDTRLCTRLASDVKALHRTIDAAPAAALVTLAFSTNVISLGIASTSGTTITPFNWDLRGPWGKAIALPGAASVISGVLAIARDATSLELFQHDYQGASKSVHGFGDRRALAWAPGFRGGALVALEVGATASELVHLDDNGRVLGEPVRVAGVVRAMSWHQEGYLVAYVDGKKTLRLAWLDANVVRIADDGLGPAPKSVAIAPVYALRALVVRGAADRVTASTVALDARNSRRLAVEKEVELLARGARVVAAGCAGSGEGNYVILDDGKGKIHAALVHEGKSTVKRVIELRGAVAHAATSGYQRIYVAWTQGRQVHLTSVSEFLE